MSRLWFSNSGFGLLGILVAIILTSIVALALSELFVHAVRFQRTVAMSNSSIATATFFQTAIVSA